MITFIPQFPGTWLNETYARACNLQRLPCKLTNVRKNKYVIYRPRSVRIGKNCALGLENGPRPAVLKTTGTVFPYTDLPEGRGTGS